jgi:toxin-antitoxin system PIN domain toxin
MIAVDTNLLVYAHRAVSDEHEAAVHAIETLASGGSAWALPWPVLHEFVKVMTSIPRERPPLDAALGMAQRLVDAPGCVVIGEAAGHLPRITDLALRGDAGGTRFYDARIAAICLGHGVREIWTADSDFSRFPGLIARNPIAVHPPEG